MNHTWCYYKCNLLKTTDINSPTADEIIKETRLMANSTQNIPLSSTETTNTIAGNDTITPMV